MEACAALLSKDRLREIPIDGGEGERGGGEAALGGIRISQANDDIDGGLAIEHDGEGCGGAGFGGDEASGG